MNLYKQTIEKFDINIDKSLMNKNQFILNTNDKNKIIYISSPTIKKGNKLYINKNFNPYIGYNCKITINDNIIHISIENYKFSIEINSDYLIEPTINGIILNNNTSIIEGKIHSNTKLPLRCNYRFIALMKSQNTPLLLLNTITKTFTLPLVEYEIIDENNLYFKISGTKISLEINAYSAKLIFDSMIEKQNKNRNNMFTPIAILKNKQDEMFVRINYLILENLKNSQIEKANLYYKILKKTDDIKLEIYEINTLWCSVALTWINQPSHTKIEEKIININNDYLCIDIKRFINYLITKTDVNHPGFVLKAQEGKITLATADSYAYPAIIEIIKKEK